MGLVFAYIDIYQSVLVTYIWKETSQGKWFLDKNLMNFYSFTMTKTCNLIKIFTKYKWTEFIHPGQEKDYGSMWNMACERSGMVIVPTLCL